MLKSKIWSKSIILCFIAFSLLHLVILNLFYDFYDWIVEWYAAVEISKGTPFYEQNTFDYGTMVIIEGPPPHLPVFFYSLALFIMVFPSEQIWGRIFLWIFTNLLAVFVIELTAPNTQKEALAVIFLFFCNPILIEVNYFGMFDQFACVFLLAGLILVKYGRTICAGVIFGLGTMTKLFPVFGFIMGAIFFIKTRKIYHLIQLIVSASLVVLSIFFIFFLESGDRILRKSLFVQFKRAPDPVPMNLSLWQYIIPQVDPLGFFIIQFIIIISIIASILVFNKKNFESFGLIPATLSVVATFVFILRTVYPHYGLWFITLQIPVIVTLFREGKYKEASIEIFSPICFFLGIIVCFLTTKPSLFHLLGVLIANIGIILAISSVFLYLKIKMISNYESDPFL